MVKKHILDIENKQWGKVADYKIRNGLKNNNEAVNKLIQKGLLSEEED